MEHDERVAAIRVRWEDYGKRAFTFPSKADVGDVTYLLARLEATERLLRVRTDALERVAPERIKGNGDIYFCGYCGARWDRVTRSWVGDHDVSCNWAIAKAALDAKLDQEVQGG